MKAGYSCPLSHSLHIIIIRHWEVKVGGTSMKDVGGAGFFGRSPTFLGRELTQLSHHRDPKI